VSSWDEFDDTTVVESEPGDHRTYTLPHNLQLIELMLIVILGAFSSLTDSMSQSTLFEKNPRPDIITNETTVVQPRPEENPQNLWEQDNLTERKVYDDLEICPTHKVRCRPNICADFADHMKKHGLDPKHFQLLGGPSNAYTLQRGESFSSLKHSRAISNPFRIEKEQQKQQDGSWEPANRRGRSRGRGRGRAMPRGPFANPW
jgi:hypothetical protein